MNATLRTGYYPKATDLPLNPKSDKPGAKLQSRFYKVDPGCCFVLKKHRQRLSKLANGVLAHKPG